MFVAEYQKPDEPFILVIDDDELLNDLFCGYFDGNGFSTEAAYGVREGLEFLISNSHVDLILLDYQLSDGTGLDLLRQLDDCPDINKPPVIMISANEDPDFLELCFSRGVADYIIKPVNLSLLALKVSTLIRSVSMQRLIIRQNTELEYFKQESEREEAIAKFTYEYLLRQNSQHIEGISIWLKSSSSFSGDMTLTKISPSGDLYFLLADATGHGLSAAITIMPVVTIFDSMVAKGFHIQSIVAEINKKLVRDTPPDRFVAAIVIQLRQEQQEIDVWNGGMPTAYWSCDGEILQEFKSQHMALGILDDDVFDANVVTLEADKSGIIVAYSDGLIEELNDEGEYLSSLKVVDIIKNLGENAKQGLVDALHKHTGRDNYKDDVSICSLNPQVIFKRCSEQFIQSLQGGVIQTNISDFSWSMRVSGNKIATSDIPPMCNKFLQDMGLNQKFCQIVFVVISEMISNAVDHGILKLNSSLKENPDGFFAYFSEREHRMKNLTAQDFLELSLRWVVESEKPQLQVSVLDSGSGYFSHENDDDSGRIMSGRGMRLIRNLTSSVEVFAPGNHIKAVISPI